MTIALRTTRRHNMTTTEGLNLMGDLVASDAADADAAALSMSVALIAVICVHGLPGDGRDA